MPFSVIRDNTPRISGLSRSIYLPRLAVSSYSADRNAVTPGPIRLLPIDGNSPDNKLARFGFYHHLQRPRYPPFGNYTGPAVRVPRSLRPFEHAPVRLAHGSRSSGFALVHCDAALAPNSSGSIRASRASVRALCRSPFRLLLETSCAFCACATITLYPNSVNSRLTRGECVPFSRAMRLCGIFEKFNSRFIAVLCTTLHTTRFAKTVHLYVPSYRCWTNQLK